MRSVATQLFVVACVFGAAVAGCTVKSTDTDVPNDNTTDASGGSGGTAGNGGSGGDVDAGDEGTGGTAGDDGGAAGAAGAAGAGGDVDAGDEGDGAPACLGDTYSTVPDCNALPYASQTCPDGNGGTYEPAGIGFCNQAATDTRSGVFESFYACLANLADPCDDGAVLACIDGTFTQACTTSEATNDCAAIAQSCPSDPDASTPFDEGTCVAYMSALRTASAAIVKECYDQTMADPDAGGTDCGTVFSQCISAF